MESSKSFFVFCGLVVTVVGIGGGAAAVADGYVAGVAVILISIPLAGLCFASALMKQFFLHWVCHLTNPLSPERGALTSSAESGVKLVGRRWACSAYYWVKRRAWR